MNRFWAATQSLRSGGLKAGFVGMMVERMGRLPKSLTIPMISRRPSIVSQGGPSWHCGVFQSLVPYWMSV